MHSVHFFVDEKEAIKSLMSLSSGKFKILLKSAKIDESSYIVDKDFKAKLYRIKINSVQLKETVEEQESTNNKVSHDRQYQIEAAVVRIMKTRKILTHNLLIPELYNQLKFPVTPVDLKKRIESLIDREYLERDEHNHQVYKYVA